MSGDVGASVAIGGVAIAARSCPDRFFLLHGDEDQIKAELINHDLAADRYEICHAPRVIMMTDTLSHALRRGRRDSSMWRSIESMAEGKAAITVSAGNTAALMAMGRLALPRIEGVNRQGIAILWPTFNDDRTGLAILIDAGATVDIAAENLLDFAVMGHALGQRLFDKEHPSVGLLNIGSEAIKGTDAVRKADAALRNEQVPLNYIGFVEGNEIAIGKADVIVTDGFTGNVAIKASEGTAQYVFRYLRYRIMSGSLLDRLVGLYLSRKLKQYRHAIEPGTYNGGVILGLEGYIVKSHGSANAEAFANAIALADKLCRLTDATPLSHDLANLKALLTSPGVTDKAVPEAASRQENGSDEK